MDSVCRCFGGLLSGISLAEASCWFAKKYNEMKEPPKVVLVKWKGTHTSWFADIVVRSARNGGFCSKQARSISCKNHANGTLIQWWYLQATITYPLPAGHFESMSFSLAGRCDCSQKRMNHIQTAMPSCTSERLDKDLDVVLESLDQSHAGVIDMTSLNNALLGSIRYKSLQIAINLPCLIPPNGKLMEISWPLTRPIPKTIPCLLPLPSASTNCHHCIPCHAIRRHFPCNGGGLTFASKCRIYGGFQKYGYPKMDGLWWKTLLKLMIWGGTIIFGNTHIRMRYWGGDILDLPTQDARIPRHQQDFVGNPGLE